MNDDISIPGTYSLHDQWLKVKLKDIPTVKAFWERHNCKQDKSGRFLLYLSCDNYSLQLHPWPQHGKPLDANGAPYAKRATCAIPWQGKIGYMLTFAQRSYAYQFMEIFPHTELRQPRSVNFWLRAAGGYIEIDLPRELQADLYHRIDVLQSEMLTARKSFLDHQPTLTAIQKYSDQLRNDWMMKTDVWADEVTKVKDRMKQVPLNVVKEFVPHSPREHGTFEYGEECPRHRELKGKRYKYNNTCPGCARDRHARNRIKDSDTRAAIDKFLAKVKESK